MNLVLCLLLAAALGIIQWMIGGVRLVYSFPAYAVVGLAAVLSLRSFRSPSARPSAVCLCSTVLFAGYVLLRGWTSPHPFLARPDLFMAAACLAVYLLAALFVVSTPARTGVVYALLGIAVAHVGVGAMQFTGGDDFMLLGFKHAVVYGTRAHGMLVNPNHLSGFLNALALFVVSFLLWGRRELPAKLLLGYLLLVCLLGIGITGSRGGYLSLIAGLLVFGGVSLWGLRFCRPARFSPALLAAAAALFLLLGGAIYSMEQSSMLHQRLLQIGDTSANARRCNWLSTLDQFRVAPVFGTGAGSYLSYGRLFRRPQFQGDPQHAYGDYLELLAEYGAVGAALGAFFLLAHLRCGVQTVRAVSVKRLTNMYGPARSDTLAVTLGALGAVAALLAHSVVDFNMHLPGNALLFAFIFGILGSPGITQSADGVPPASRVELGARGVLGLAGGVLLLVILFQYPAELASERAARALDANDAPALLRLSALAVQKKPANPYPYFYQGEAFRATAAALPHGDSRESYLNEAIAAYRKGLQWFPEDENLWVRLGQCLDSAHRLPEAEEAYDNAIAWDPNLGILYVYYAAHLERTGDTEGARRSRATARAFGVDPSRKSSMSEPPSFLNTDAPRVRAAPESSVPRVPTLEPEDLP